MPSAKSLDFSNYSHYEITTQGQYQQYIVNQNVLLTEVLALVFWTPQTAYAVGKVIYCGGGLWATCTTAGTSGATEPTWAAGTINDGSAVWHVELSVTITQITGQSTTIVMSQKAVTDELNKKFNINQGAANAGKMFVVNAAGNLELIAGLKYSNGHFQYE